MAIVSLYLCG